MSLHAIQACNYYRLLFSVPGASDEIHDLLPNPVFDSWTKNLPSDDGKESDQIFAFDGQTNAIEVRIVKHVYSNDREHLQH